MRMDAVLAFASKSSFTIAECEELAKDLDAFDKMTFDLVGPKGRKTCKWVDAYFGLFELEGVGLVQSAQFKYVGDLRCENLDPHIATKASAIEAQRATTVQQGVVHESAVAATGGETPEPGSRGPDNG